MDPEFLNTENEHEHDTTVSSLAVVEKRPLDLDSIQTLGQHSASSTKVRICTA